MIASVEAGKGIDTKEKKKYVCDAITTYLIDKLHAEKIMRHILVDESHQLLDESLKEVYALQQKYCDRQPIGVADSVIKELTKSV